MLKYSDTEKKILRRNSSNIAGAVGCSQRYVSDVLRDKVLRDTKTTRAIRIKASQVLAVLSVSDMT